MVALLAAIGSFVANIATSGCLFVFVDEPTAPRSIIEK